MSLPFSISALALAALTATALPGYGEGEISSEQHPALQRALTESPEADKDGNGVLSLAEYIELLPHQRPNDPEHPKAPLLPVRQNGDLVIHDFEEEQIGHKPKWSPVPQQQLKDNKLRQIGGNWTQEGDAFNRNLRDGTKMMKRRVGPYEGKYFLTTITNSEAATGRVLSPVFLIEQDYITITMSGGGIPARICVNLHLDEGIVRSATGQNDDYFETVAFDVREFRGQFARIELLDNHRGLWGHLNVDEILMTSAAGRSRVISSTPVPVVSTEDVAITTAGRITGSLRLENGQLAMADAPLSEEVLLTINARSTNDRPARGAVHLLNGEVWRAEVQNVEGAGRKKTLAIHSKSFGARKVPLSNIASMEFVAGGPGAPREPGTLYHTEGEPVPGTLIWVRAKDVAIRSSLGIIPIPRGTVQRFVLADPNPPVAQMTDEIGLTDGSLIFGKTRFEGSQLIIAHDVLGDLKVAWNTVRYLRRHLPGVTWLDSLERTVTEAIGPALPPPAPQLLEAVSSECRRTLRVMPHTTVRMQLPSPHEGGTLRGLLDTVPGCRANLKVSILDGDTTVWTQQLRPNDDPIPLSIALSRGELLTLKVEFDGPLAFPCGIDLHDAHVLISTTHITEPLPKEQN